MNNDSDTAGIFRIKMCKIILIDGNILQRILRITILSEDMDLIFKRCDDLLVERSYSQHAGRYEINTVKLLSNILLTK